MSEQPKRYNLWSCQNVCDPLYYLLDNIFIRSGSKLYRQIVDIPMGSCCRFFFVLLRERLMLALSDKNQTNIIEAFNSPSRLSSKIYDKRDDFNFEIANSPFLDGDVDRTPSYGVYISQLIRFARICSNISYFNTRNLFLNAKLLKQGYRCDKLPKAIKFYRRHSLLIV